MLKVGLTGGIASGKSTVAKLFETLDIPVIYADKIAREVVAPGSEGLHKVRTVFGEEIIAADGELDRQSLRHIVFSDPDKRKLLESILHPLIRAQSDALESAAAKAGAHYVVFEIPLLLETDRYKDMHRVLVVDVEESTQIQRVMSRDACSEQQAKKILAVQSTRADRLAIAHDVIKNDGDIEHLESSVINLHKLYLKLAIDS